MLGDRRPTMAELKQLPFATRVINEAMRLYPQPPVLIRRALEPDSFAGYHVAEGSDIFISVWNLHRRVPSLPETPSLPWMPCRCGNRTGACPVPPA